MVYRLDQIDERIIYRLVEDARRVSAPDIADELDVSSGTINNRINQLEAEGIIRGYHAAIDYERGDDLLTNLFICTTTATDREKYAKQVLQIPGVVNVREVMAGRGDLRVKGVGADTDDITRIAKAIANLGIEIEEEDFVHREHFHPYHPFGPDTKGDERAMTDFMSLAGNAEVIDLSVNPGVPITERTLAEANESGLLDDEVRVIAIEREDTVITPTGDTIIEPDDLITVFSQDGVSGDILRVFTGEASDSEG